jgi:serine/threonine protein kinase
MGEVYRARDSKLKRDVAIKILPNEFSSDARRVSRFQREAEVLASLNHPHIGAIYDLAHFGESQFLILELVEGETLADRISRGPIALQEALPIAQQIAGALEAAHEKGIVHRDLKPANIKIRPDGTVKVLDFGLAKVREGAGTDQMNSPTILSISEPGMLLGTAAYMSPEQAKGKDADRTSDVWAFGCVLFEMLTGRRAFKGESSGEILAAVLKEEPGLDRVPWETPQSIRRLLRRGLQKDPRFRLHDMADVRLEIEEALSGSIPDGVQSLPRSKDRLRWIAALAFVSVIAAIAILFSFRPSPAPPERRLEITTPPTKDPAGIALSSDGEKVVFIATSEGRSKLWVRSLDSVSSRPLPGTDAARGPFWSPDSRSIGFFSGGKLRRIDIEGELVQPLADADSRGGSWNQDGVIIFVKNAEGPIFRVASSGGEEAIPVTKLDPPRQSSHRYPQFLPDGRHFLYYAYGTAPGTYVGQLDGSEPKKLDMAGMAAVYAASGHLLFMHQETLFAQKFDPVKLELTGDAFVIVEGGLAYDPATLVALSTSAAGPIAYRPRSGRRQFIWFDRSGTETGRVGEPEDGRTGNPSPTPFWDRIALQRTIRDESSIWLLETERGVLSRLSEGKTGVFPVLSPDGSRIVFTSDRDGLLDLYWKSVDQAGDDEPLLKTAQGKVANDWSRDGKFLLYISNADPKIGLPQTMWALPIDGDRSKLTKITERAGMGKFSPDVEWVSYVTLGASPEIYVQSFPYGNYKQLLSVGGGSQGKWRSDGKEFFYIAPDGWLMAVPIRPGSDGKPIKPGKPARLFPTRLGSPVGTFWNTAQYLVSDDGQKFLMNTVIEEEGSSPIEIILNWRPERGK